MRSSASSFARSAALLLAAAALGACHDHSGVLREPDEYLGCASDESWRTFDDWQTTGRTRPDAASGPRLTQPAPGTLDAAPTFTWEISASVPGQPNGTVTCTKCATCGTLGPAHEPPISGDVYDLQFSADGAVVWRVLTTKQAYAAPAALWDALRGKTFSLKLVRATVMVNDVTEGPFESAAPLTFQAR
jgi:hypothetical protein